MTNHRMIRMTIVWHGTAWKKRTTATKTTTAKKDYMLLSYSFLNAGLRFSVNAVIPSFWSCVENKDWNRRRSRRIPSASVSS